MLNIAFIGCGRIAAKHFDALDSLQTQIRVQALCDVNIELAHKVRSRACNHSAAVYGNIEAMLAKESGLHAAVIALPNGLHAQAGIQCARSKLHVIMEKPLAVQLTDGQVLVATCRRHNVELFLVHQNRFNEPVQHLHRAICDRHLGRIYNIYANVFWQRPQSYYESEGNWHGCPQMDGGAFYTQASHYVDMVQWLAGGLPRRVAAHARTLARNIATEDCGSAFMEWGEPGQPDNLIATINMSLLAYPCNLEGSVTVLAEKGAVKIGGTAMNRIEHWRVADQPNNPTEVMQDINYATDSVYGFGHRSLYAAIAAKLRGETQLPSIEAALIYGKRVLDNLLILDAISRSATVEGQPQTLVAPKSL